MCNHSIILGGFFIPEGKIFLLLEDHETGETREMIMGVNNFKTIKIEPDSIHAIKNIGEEYLVLIVYSNDSFDPDDPRFFLCKDIGIVFLLFSVLQ